MTLALYFKDGKSQVTISMPGEPDVTFPGSFVASVTQITEKERSGWVYSIFTHDDGGLVCFKSYSSQYNSYQSDTEVKRCMSSLEVTQFFEFGDLAKELYKKAGIPYEVQI